MKRTWLIVGVSTGIAGVVGFYAAKLQPRPSALAPLPTAEQNAPAAGPEPSEVSTSRNLAGGSGPKAAGPAPAEQWLGMTSAVPNTPSQPVSVPFNLAMEYLTSPQASYQQRQAAWRQLHAAGKLDAAIAELEKRAAANPAAPEYPAALGQGYLQKAGSIQDVREQGILGMRADQAFDAALDLDPANWEARFWKACAMSYWPPQLNKGPEVIEHFVELVKQQETMPPQPQFAQTYLLLGEQYQKQGAAEYARAVWQRGAQFFPDNPALKDKLAARP